MKRGWCSAVSACRCPVANAAFLMRGGDEFVQDAAVARKMRRAATSAQRGELSLERLQTL